MLERPQIKSAHTTAKISAMTITQILQIHQLSMAPTPHQYQIVEIFHQTEH